MHRINTYYEINPHSPIKIIIILILKRKMIWKYIYSNFIYDYLDIIICKLYAEKNIFSIFIRKSHIIWGSKE